MRKEYALSSESQARIWQSKKEAEGWEVSLLAYDVYRNVYAFDTNEPVEEMKVRSCGNCGGPHPSEDDVLVCYAERPVYRERVRGERSYNTYPPRYVADSKYAKPRVWLASDAGIYKDPCSERIFKVYESIQSGRILCKTLVVDKYQKKGKFVYQGMASRFVKHEWLMPLEEAQKFGQVYGICCVCGRTLTDETSIANGIGPICAGKFSL